MLSRSLVLRYHGCDLSTAKRVVSGEIDLYKSEKPYDWLGHGVYFWEDSFDRALQWAIDRAKYSDSKLKTPAVLGAVIDLRNCLNLIDSYCLKLVEGAYSDYVKLCHEADLELCVNKGKSMQARYLDCAVFETLHRLREHNNLPAFDTVRGFFVEGEPLYEGAQVRNQDHIQICVRNTDQILGYFLPKVTTYNTHVF